MPVLEHDAFVDVRNLSTTDIKRFIEVNAAGNANSKNPHSGMSLLHMAADNSGNDKVTEVLISMGADVNAKDNKGGFSPLHIAAMEGNTKIAEILISHGANVNAKENNDFTPLHMAAMKENVEIAKALISHGANVNAKSRINAKGESYTPLDLAKQLRRTAMIQYLSSTGGSGR